MLLLVMSAFSILMYADDIVLLANNEHDLQNMLDTLDRWCNLSNMCVNNAKSGVVHFRPPSIPRLMLILCVEQRL